MSIWVRIENVEDSFEEMHKVKPMIYRLMADPRKFNDNLPRNISKVKLVLNGKELILTEEMERGLTKEVTLENGVELNIFKSVYLAEQAAAEILRS